MCFEKCWLKMNLEFGSFMIIFSLTYKYAEDLFIWETRSSTRRCNFLKCKGPKSNSSFSLIEDFSNYTFYNSSGAVKPYKVFFLNE